VQTARARRRQLLQIPGRLIHTGRRWTLLLAAIFGANLVAIAACLASGPHILLAGPSPLFFLLATMDCICVLTVTTQQIEIYHRTQSVIDPLTGLFNRSGLARRFSDVRAQSLATGQSVSVIACDLDHFKQVNDEHGHVVGDAVLKDVAYTMRKILRHGDVIYRVGGEEFVILLPGLEMRAAVEAADRLRAGIADSTPAGVSMTMSFGVATLDPAHLDWAELYGAADARLYEAKQRGRNQVRPEPEATLRLASTA
jgi:diguanylate cyclase (GGDEF)-like protein